jgi:soluble lytic murein transglycosylase-like protein
MGRRALLYAIITLALLSLSWLLFGKWLLSKMRSVENDQTTLDELAGLCAQFGIPVNLAKGFIKEESSWDPRAYNPPSSSNALASYGLMQITLMVAQDAGLVADWRNPTDDEIEACYDPYNNMLAGLGDFAKVYGRYPLDVAIQMYNVGETGYNVNGWRNEAYAANVMKYYQDYGGGGDDV